MTWQNLTLAHYSGKAIDGPLRPAERTAVMKPRGVWLSVDGPYDWPSWCTDEGWNVESLALRYVVNLASSARILFLKNEDEVAAFNQAHSVDKRFAERIDWDAVYPLYDGIIIAPYQWQCRHDFLWYYGWDCASGCVWNTDVIERVTLDESWVVPKRNEDAA